MIGTRRLLILGKSKYSRFSDFTTLPSGLAVLPAGAAVAVAGGRLQGQTLAVNGYELPNNREFTTNTTGWFAAAGATLSREDAAALGISPTGGVDDGILKILCTGTTTPTASQTFTATLGTTYQLSCQAYAPSANTAVNAARLYVTGGLPYLAADITTEDSWKTLSLTRTATGATVTMGMAASGLSVNGEFSYFDAFSCQQMTAILLDDVGSPQTRQTVAFPMPAAPSVVPRSVVVRVADALNLWEVRLTPNTAGNDCQIIEHVAGLQTPRAAVDVDWTAGQTDSVRVTAIGPVLTVEAMKSGAASWSTVASYATMTTGLSNTKHGIGIYDTTVDIADTWLSEAL